MPLYATHPGVAAHVLSTSVLLPALRVPATGGQAARVP